MAEPLRDLRAKVHGSTWAVIEAEHAAELEQRRGLR